MKRILLTLLVALLFANGSNAIGWLNLGTGLNGRVKAITVFNGEIYAAGTFTSPKHIAKWNGTTWVEVGNGLNDSVNVLYVFNSKLYAGGHFKYDGTNSTALHHIAAWDGSAWSNVGTGGDSLNNFVRAIYSLGSNLYVGGAFINCGNSHNVSRIAKFDGTSWSQLGASPSNVVNTIIEYNGSLYMGGPFPGYLAVLNASQTTWTTVTGLNNEVMSLAVYQSKLWVGGKSQMPYAYLSKWNGSSYESALNQPNSYVDALLSTGTHLYAGGAFTQISSVSVAHVGSYNGSPWAAIGGGANGDVLELGELNGKLIIGGVFTTAGGTSAANIAITTGAVGIDELDENIISNVVFPNPVTTEAVLKVKTKSEMLHPSVKLMDILGKEMNPVIEMTSFNRFSHEAEFKISREGLPSGIYFYDLKDDDVRVAAGKIVVE